MLCRFLAVHDWYKSDRIFTGYLRVMAHADAQKSAIWNFVEHDGKRYLQIKTNRAGSATHTAGWYLAEPPSSERDSVSNWMAVTPNLDEAMAVEAKAYSP